MSENEMPPIYHAHNHIILRCTFIDVDNIGGYSWRFVLPLDSVRTWRSLCDKLSTCLSLIRDLEGVPYPGETTFWAKDINAGGFICKEDWEQLVYGGGKYELIFRANARIKHPPGRSANRTPGMPVEVAALMDGVLAQAAREQNGSTRVPRFAGGERNEFARHVD